MNKRKFVEQHDLNERYYCSTDLKEIEELLLEGAYVNYKSFLGFYKSEECNFETLKLLVSKGLDLNMKNFNGETVLEKSVRYYLKFFTLKELDILKELEKIKYLMYNGADATEALQLIDKRMNPELYRILKIENIEKVKNLLRENLYEELCENVIKFFSFD
jgi:ankyrin repeat protein